MKSCGMVLEGGGMRGVYTAGVLDFFMDQNFYPDGIVGVSAGACHATSYISKQRGRNYRVNTAYLKGKDYYIIGHLKNYEEKGDNSWLALSAFAKFDRINNKNYNNEPNHMDNNKVFITIRFTDIEYIEIYILSIRRLILWKRKGKTALC